MSEPVYCPHCDAANEAGRERCQQCGEPLAPADEFSAAATELDSWLAQEAPEEDEAVEWPDEVEVPHAEEAIEWPDDLELPRPAEDESEGVGSREDTPIPAERLSSEEEARPLPVREEEDVPDWLLEMMAAEGAVRSAAPERLEEEGEEDTAEEEETLEEADEQVSEEAPVDEEGFDWIETDEGEGVGSRKVGNGVEESDPTPYSLLPRRSRRLRRIFLNGCAPCGRKRKRRRPGLKRRRARRRWLARWPGCAAP